LVHVSPSVATTTTFLTRTKSACNSQIRQSTLNEHQNERHVTNQLANEIESLRTRRYSGHSSRFFLFVTCPLHSWLKNFPF
jgi:hypothetical protein